MPIDPDYPLEADSFDRSRESGPSMTIECSYLLIIESSLFGYGSAKLRGFRLLSL